MVSRSHAVAARLVASVLVFGLIGCSDDESSAERDETTTTTTVLVTTTEAPESTTTTIDPEKQAFVAAGDAICGDMNDDIDALIQIYEAGPKTPATTAAALEEIAVEMELAVAELRTLTPPAHDETDVEAMLTTFDDLIALSRQLGSAIEAGEVIDVGVTGDELDRIASEADARFGDYGFIECGRARGLTV